MTRLAPTFSLGLGGVLLALAVFAIEIRMDDPWAEGVLFAVAATGAIGLFALSRAPTRDENRPSGASSALLLSAIAVTAIVIYRVAHLLRGHHGDSLDARGTLTWAFAALAAVAFAAAARSRSAACLLVGAVAAGATILAGTSWIFDTTNTAVSRAVLCGLAVVYAASAALARGRHREVLVGAAGLALLGIGLVSLTLFGGSLPDAWEAVLLVGALALVTFSVATRAPGPGVLGLLTSAAFLASIVAPGSGYVEDDSDFVPNNTATLVGWPLVLLIAAALALAFGVARSRR